MSRKAISEMTEEELVESREIVFYCKDCGDIVKTTKVGNRYVYKCNLCGTKNVAFGSKRSIFSFFNLDEAKLEKLRAGREDEKSEKKEEDSLSKKGRERRSKSGVEKK